MPRSQRIPDGIAQGNCGSPARIRTRAEDPEIHAQAATDPGRIHTDELRIPGPGPRPGRRSWDPRPGDGISWARARTLPLDPGSQAQGGCRSGTGSAPTPQISGPRPNTAPDPRPGPAPGPKIPGSQPQGTGDPGAGSAPGPWIPGARPRAAPDPMPSAHTQDLGTQTGLCPARRSRASHIPATCPRLARHPWPGPSDLNSNPWAGPLPGPRFRFGRHALRIYICRRAGEIADEWAGTSWGRAEEEAGHRDQASDIQQQAAGAACSGSRQQAAAAGSRHHQTTGNIEHATSRRQQAAASTQQTAPATTTAIARRSTSSRSCRTWDRPCHEHHHAGPAALDS